MQLRRPIAALMTALALFGGTFSSVLPSFWSCPAA
jgi:hypothetical protein